MTRNLSWSREVWRRMARIFIREGAAPLVSWLFFKAVVKAVLLLGLDTWVVTPHMGKELGEFQVQMVRRLTGRLMWRKTDGKWIYTSVKTAREEEGFLTMEEYIRWRHNTVAQYIAMRSLLDLCERPEKAPGARVGIWWWEQAGIDLAGAREAAVAAVAADGYEGEEWRRGIEGGLSGQNNCSK